MSDLDRERRWKEEAVFFDSLAGQHSSRVDVIHPLVLSRYSAPSPRRRFSLEYRFRLLGNLQNREILDVGCGEGTNSILLAKLGAHVTGVDISPASIDLAQKKARVNGLEGVTRFVCSPLEAVDICPHSFDVVWGDAILHHLIGDLDGLMVRLINWAKPGGLIVLCEPVNLNDSLRRLRSIVPVKTRATPDERPLEAKELAIIRRHLPNLRIRHFRLLGRLNRLILSKDSYEFSSLPRRAVANILVILDYGLLSLPWIKNLGGGAVMWGKPGVDSS